MVQHPLFEFEAYGTKPNRSTIWFNANGLTLIEINQTTKLYSPMLMVQRSQKSRKPQFVDLGQFMPLHSTKNSVLQLREVYGELILIHLCSSHQT
jgi:hypothetical protein